MSIEQRIKHILQKISNQRQHDNGCSENLIEKEKKEKISQLLANLGGVATLLATLKHSPE